MPDDSIDINTAKLSRLRPGEQFAYTFDFGDDWQHLCAAGDKRIDPEEVYGLEPSVARAVLGLGRASRPIRPTLGRRRRRIAASP